VSKTPVSEVYTVNNDGHLCLTEMDFEHEGPGMPSSPEEGTTWRIEGGKAFVKEYSSCLDRLDLGIAPFGHHLRIGALDMDLVAEIGPDRLVSVSIERLPLILIIFAEARPWLNRQSRL
jgi:hypothetical protein